MQADKEALFREIIQKDNIPLSDILVVGDSYEREIPAAKSIGLDYLHISDFVKWNQGRLQNAA
jgi:FMN phosphatase YigB (HAD superfamily)